MQLFQKIENYLSSFNGSKRQSTSQKYEIDQEKIQHLSTAECLEVAGGPQVRNDPDIE